MMFEAIPDLTGFYGADLRDADLRAASLRRANFLGADLRGAKLPDNQKGNTP